MSDSDTPVLDRLLDPLASKLSPAAARIIVDFRADRATQSHVARLARKCSLGKLSAAERREYEAYVRGIDFIAILQSKARQLLGKPPQR